MDGDEGMTGIGSEAFLTLGLRKHVPNRLKASVVGQMKKEPSAQIDLPDAEIVLK